MHYVSNMLQKICFPSKYIINDKINRINGIFLTNYLIVLFFKFVSIFYVGTAIYKLIYINLIYSIDTNRFNSYKINK